MNNNKDNSIVNNLTSYIESFRPIIYIKHFDYGLVDELIKDAVKEVSKKYSKIKIFEYFVEERDFECKKSTDSPWGNNLCRFLFHYNEGQEKGSDEISILLLKDINHELQNPDVVSYLKHIALQTQRLEHKYNDCIVIMVSFFQKIPTDLQKMITFLEIPEPDSIEIENIIGKWDIKDYSKNNFIEEDFKKSLVNLLKGFSRYEILQMLDLIHSNKGKITKEDRDEILHEKKQLIKKSNLLEFVNISFETNNIDEVIGGLDNLKRWLRNTLEIFIDIESAEKSKVTIPKGILLLGIPGCGKSLVSKFISAMLKLPLLKLDIGNLLGKYLGESEENLRIAISYAEAVSPCVLWLDEIEKAFSGVGKSESHEVTNRLFGSFLTWLQECQYPVFTVATSNNVSNLPPEFLRKGRFNEIFFVDLPDEKEREEIFKIKIKDKKIDIANLNINSLSVNSKKYTGADIEAVVNEVCIKNFIRSQVLKDTEYHDRPISQEDFNFVMKNIVPYGKVFGDNIEEIKKYIDKKNITFANDKKIENQIKIPDYGLMAIKEKEEKEEEKKKGIKY